MVLFIHESKQVDLHPLIRLLTQLWPTKPIDADIVRRIFLDGLSRDDLVTNKLGGIR